MVTREVHGSSLRRLIYPDQDHFIFLTWMIVTFVLSLTHKIMLVFLSLYMMSSMLLSILVCAAARLFCACLVRVQVLVLFLEVVALSQEYVALNVFYQHIVNVYRGVVYNHHLCLCDVHLKTHSPILSSDSS